MSSITTSRLVLDPVTLYDSDFLDTLFSYADVKKYYVLRDDHAKDIELFTRYMVQAIQQQRSLQYIVRLSNNTPIGLVGGELYRERTGGIAWNTSYAIIPTYRNRGYATEALKGFTEHISQYSISKSFLDISDDNETSKRVAVKAGYKYNKDTAHFDPNHPELSLLFHWEKSLGSAREQYFMMGVQAFRANDMHQAANMFAKALEEPYVPGSQSTDALCNSNMGIASSHAGMYQQAYNCLKKAQSLGLNNATIQKELLWLKNNRGIG